MATKSILKTVYIKDNESARRLVSALENADRKGAEPVKFRRSYAMATEKEMQEMFSKEG